jgi:hypothetical protein
MNMTVNDRAAEIMDGIKASIATAHAVHVASQDVATAKKAAIEIENRRILAESRAYFEPILDRAVKGCKAILTVIEESPDLQELIHFVESRGYTNIPKRFHLFMKSIRGGSPSSYEADLYLSLRGSVAIEMKIVDRYNRGKPVIITRNDHLSGVPSCSRMNLRQSICGWTNRNFHEDPRFLQNMMLAYQKIRSPLSWDIPPNFFVPATLPLLALRILEQCSQPHLLARHMDWALKHNAPSAGK